MKVPETVVRGVVRWLLAAALLLMGVVLPTSGGTLAQAAFQTGQRAGIVISYGNRVETHCIDLGADGQATGEEVLRATGATISADYGSGMGAGVCKIQEVGCSFPAESCFCQCTLTPGQPCRYWGYSHLENGQWRSSNRGATTSIVEAGGVEGWAWAESSVSNPAAPPVVPFDQICLTIPTATATPEPSPTETATPEPTATTPPTETPVPTETASSTPLPPTETPLPSATPSPVPSNTPLPSATLTVAPSATLPPASATASAVAATRTATARASATRAATNSPVPSATPTLRPTWTRFPATATPTEAAVGGAGEEPPTTPTASATVEPTASRTTIPTLTVSLPSRTATRSAPTATREPSATATNVPDTIPSPTLADIAVAVSPAAPTPAGETLVESAQASNMTGYLIFGAMVLLLGGTLVALRVRQR